MQFDFILWKIVLILDAPANVAPAAPRRIRDSHITSLLTDAQKRGNVLIPITSTTRILELSYLLDQYFAFNKLSNLYFLSNQSRKTLVQARSMLEWMGDGVSQSQMGAGVGDKLPFDFSTLKCVQSIDEIDLGSGCVVLASCESLDHGFSRELFQRFIIFLIRFRWASNPNNTVILPERGPSGSLARRLYDYWDAVSAEAQSPNDCRNPVLADLFLPMEVFFRLKQIIERVALEGEELELHLAEEAARLDVANVEIATVDADMNDSDSEDDLEMADTQGLKLEQSELHGDTIYHHSYDIFVKETDGTSTGFFKQFQNYTMFPVHEVQSRIDDYGEIIDLEFYRKFAEKVPETTKDVLMDVGSEPALVAEYEFNDIVTYPFKYTTRELNLHVACQLHYIDFSGRSDHKSVVNIIQHISPKRLVFFC